MSQLLHIENLEVGLESEEEILRGVDLDIHPGETHVIMGPNGSGKSTLANTIMGSPAYHVRGGRIFFEGEDVTGAPVDVRAKLGLFMAFQAPEEVDGITLSDFLKTAIAARQEGPPRTLAFRRALDETLETLDFDPAYAQRYLNVGFSGGEKKKSEILQMLMLRPRLAILDETDSGLDVDAVKTVTEGIRRYLDGENALLIISHSTRLLDELPIDRVHVLVDGRIAHTGDRELIREIHENGFARFTGAAAER